MAGRGKNKSCLWICITEIVCGKKRQAGPAGPGQQSQAGCAESCSRGFKQAPACNIDETGAPCRTVGGPRPCLDVTPSLFLTVGGRVDTAGHHFGWVLLGQFQLHLSVKMEIKINYDFFTCHNEHSSYIYLSLYILSCILSHFRDYSSQKLGGGGGGSSVGQCLHFVIFLCRSRSVFLAC